MLKKSSPFKNKCRNVKVVSIAYGNTFLTNKKHATQTFVTDLQLEKINKMQNFIDHTSSSPAVFENGVRLSKHGQHND